LTGMYSDNATTICKARYHVFQYERFAVKILLKWKRTRVTWREIEVGLKLI